MNDLLTASVIALYGLYINGLLAIPPNIGIILFADCTNFSKIKQTKLVTISHYACTLFICIYLYLSVIEELMIRKLKKWWSTIPPISIKLTITPHHNPINTKIYQDLYDVGNIGPAFESAVYCKCNITIKQNKELYIVNSVLKTLDIF